MRDPAGRTRIVGDWVLRSLDTPASSNHFLRSNLAARWVGRGDLVSYEWLDEQTLRSRRLPFITYPDEWSAPQFYAAADLTLRLQSEATSEGWDLKDASAWNVVFEGLRPVFVDLLSFEKLHTKLWRAAGQFSRHFLIPLLLAQQRNLEPRQCMQLWRDGVPPEVARQMLGLGRYFSRYWPLMAAGNGDAALTAAMSSVTPLAQIMRFRARLHASLAWMLSGLYSTTLPNRNTLWSRYEQERIHYTEASLDFKRKTVKSWLENLRPLWVLDIGCNAGEFSDLAVALGARVICWDADPQAVATICQRRDGDLNYFPILCPVDDISGGRGWSGEESLALMRRLEQQVDVVMLLAVIHHLAIASGIRLEEIFRFAAAISRRAVLLELISENDQRLIQLCRQYGRSTAEFTLRRQVEAAQAAGYRIVERVKQSPGDTRELMLLERVSIEPESAAQSEKTPTLL